MRIEIYNPVRGNSLSDIHILTRVKQMQDEKGLFQKHYSVLVGFYEQHSDLFVKAYLVYLATVGTAAGFYFRDRSNPVFQQAIAGFIILVSALCLAGTITGLIWGKKMEKLLNRLETDIHTGLPHLPLFGGIVLAWVSTIGAGLILAVGVILYFLI